MRILKNPHGNYSKIWNGNYGIVIHGDFLIFIMETVLFPYRNYNGNFHLSINVKWHVTREWEEFCFRANGISL